MDTDLKSSTVPAEKKIEIVREALLKEVEFLYKNSLLNHKFIKEDVFNKEAGTYSEYYNKDMINSFKGIIDESREAVSGKNDSEIQLRKIEELDNNLIYSIDNQIYKTNDKDVDEKLDFRAVKTKKQIIKKEEHIKVINKKYIEEKIKEDVSFHASPGEELYQLREELKKHKESSDQINLVIDLLSNKMKTPTENTGIGLNGDIINKVLLYLTRVRNASSADNYQEEFNKIAGAPGSWKRGGYVKVNGLRTLKDVSGSPDTYSNPDNIKKVFEPWKDKTNHNALENELYCMDQSFVYLPSKEGGKIPNVYYQIAYNNNAKETLLKEMDADKKEVK